MCRRPKGITVDAAAMRARTLLKLWTVIFWPSLIFFRVFRMDLIHAGDSCACDQILLYKSFLITLCLLQPTDNCADSEAKKAGRRDRGFSLIPMRFSHKCLSMETIAATEWLMARAICLVRETGLCPGKVQKMPPHRYSRLC